MLAGLAVGIGFKAGLFNIGAQGQFLIGGLAAAAVGVATVQACRRSLAIPAALLAGIVAGRRTASFPGVLKAHPAPMRS